MVGRGAWVCYIFYCRLLQYSLYLLLNMFTEAKFTILVFGLVDVIFLLYTL